MDKTIIKNQGILRTYLVNNKTIENIYLYDKGNIIIHIRRGWLECVKNDYSYIYLGDLTEITIDKKVKRANKLNLNRKDNFLLKEKSEYRINDGVSLYININNIFKNFKYLPKKYNDKNTHYLYGINGELKYPAKTRKLYLKYYKKGDIIDVEDKGKKFELCYKKDENGELIKDKNGKYIKDENKYYCTIIKEIEVTNVNLYNGLYITSGK